MSKQNGPTPFLINLVGHEQKRLKTPDVGWKFPNLFTKVIVDYDYIGNVIDYDYDYISFLVSSLDYDYDYSKNCNRL